MKPRLFAGAISGFCLAGLLAARTPSGATVAFIANNESAHVSAYMPGLADDPDISSVVMADASGGLVPAARRIIGKKLTATYTSTDELFRHQHPVLAVITLEPRLAPAAIEAALDAGCHVLVEKPACLQPEEFARLARKAEQKKLCLMLALGNRINPEMRLARDLIQQGRIGKIYGIELHIIADQTRLTKPDYWQSWFAHKSRAGGGHLIWLGIHWLDLGMYLTHSSITEVAGFTANVGGQPIDVEDSAVFSLKFDNGTLGTITSAYYLDKSYHSHIKIWGSRGWLEIDPYGEDQLMRYYSTLDPKPAIRTYARPADIVTGYSALVAVCVRAALGLEPPPVTPAESLRVLRTVFACYRSAETGRAQPVAAGRD